MSDAISATPASLPIKDHVGLRLALRDANLPTLLMVYVTFTQDRVYLDRFAPYLAAAYAADAPSNVPDTMAQDLRDRLFALLTHELPPLVRPLDPEFLRHMMSVSVGENVDPGLIPVLYDQMGFEPPVPRKCIPGRRTPPSDFDVIVIGGGMSGIAAGIKLSEANYSYTIIEKNAELGGTWWENRYPGVGVDTPSHFYSYSFELNPEWSVGELCHILDVEDLELFELLACCDVYRHRHILQLLRLAGGGNDDLVAQAFLCRLRWGFCRFGGHARSSRACLLQAAART